MSAENILYIHQHITDTIDLFGIFFTDTECMEYSKKWQASSSDHS